METINNKRNKNYFLKILNNSNTKQTRFCSRPCYRFFTSKITLMLNTTQLDKYY